MSRISKPDNHVGKATTRKVVRNPKCARCRNHGFVVQLKGHAGKCPFSPCDCWKCSLITERTKIMAIQRRMGKNQNDESLSNVRSSLKETQPQASSGAEIIDVTLINDPANVSVNDSGPHHDSTTGHRASTIQRTPPARRIEADGTAHFNGDYIIAAVAQRDVYSSEFMTLPFPIKFYSPYPNSYGCPAILLNVPPPPASGAYNDPQMSFPSFHPSTVPYSPDSGPSQEYQVPFLNPLPVSARSLGPQEELALSHPSYLPTLHKHRGLGGGDHEHGN
ncbi:doublesex- and mab-3-related transcription factor 1-like isoform X2 [Conger conger]|uniref:doublesex- and mab-3-related transcription factor 1-like isoform X2 n=1 Tax=Conger conger TaxID=82655 RepID=UPI002A5A8357|nr:doublesex- and mab-3-related transcription factor 1-like isoform X2 [Conger conger]